MAKNFSVRVFDGAINAMFNPGGEAHSETGKIVRDIRLQAIAAAPVRSGELKRGHRANVTPGNFRKKVTGQVYNVAKHAVFVVLGTGGPGRIITSSRPGGYLLVRLRPHSWYRWGWARPGMRNGVPRDYVRGQRANDYIERAANRVLSRYR